MPVFEAGPSGEAKREVFGVVAATLGLVFLVIAAVLESWKLAAWSRERPPSWQGLAITVTGGLLASALLAPGARVALISWREARRSGRPGVGFKP